MYLSDIEKSDMPNESKLIAVLSAKKTIRKLKNQKNIVDIAINNAKDGTDFTRQSKVDADWFERFMDSAGFVSSDDLQQIWGKILSKEFENPGSTPSSMIRILTEITSACAQAFRKICSMQSVIVEINENGELTKASQKIIVPLSHNHTKFSKDGLSLSILNELEILGLVKFDPLADYQMEGDMEPTILIYSENKTDVIIKRTANSLPIGNILLTAAGECLKSITPLENIPDYNSMVKKYMMKQGVEFMNEPNYKIFKNGNEVRVTKSI